MNGDDEDRSLVVPGDTPRAMVDVDRAVKEWDLYQQLTRRLLTKEDYQDIAGKKFKRKSAWRKYAKAFNVSCALVKEEIARAEDGYPLYARVWARAEEPSGRWQVADQECHVKEKCCPVASGGICKKGGQHSHCRDGCDGRIHFSHPGDISATAVTRAKNRAISDLIGAGEISAEEAAGGNSDPASRPARRPAATAAPAAATENGAPMSDNQRKAIRASLNDLFPKDERAQFEMMKELQPKAAQGTEIHLTGLTTSEAALILKALNDERDHRTQGE